MLILAPTVMELERLFGADLAREVLTRRSASIPTEYEPVEIALAGLGLAAAGAGAAAAMARHRHVYPGLPRFPHAILIGIAGAFDPVRNPPGSVIFGAEVCCDGVGYGRGGGHQAAATAEQAHAYRGLAAAGEAFALNTPRRIEPSAPSGAIVSVASSSGTAEQAAEIAERHPGACVEDMESFAVALAARLESFRLTVIRGISNVAGDRDHDRWKIGEALEAAQLYLDLTMQAYSKVFQ